MAAAGVESTRTSLTFTGLDLSRCPAVMPAMCRILTSKAVRPFHDRSLSRCLENHGLSWNLPTTKMASGSFRVWSRLSMDEDFWSREGRQNDAMVGRRSFDVRAMHPNYVGKSYLRSAQDKVEMLVKNVCKSGKNVKEVLSKEGQSLKPLDWFNVLEGIGRRRQWLLALEVFRWIQVQRWYTPDNGYYAKLISIMGKERQYAMAMMVFKEVRKIGCRPDTSLYNSVMSVHLRSQDKEKGFVRACELLETMKNIRRCQPNVVTYNMLARNAAQLGRHDVVVSMIEEMYSRGIRPDNYTFNGIMHAYGSAGDIDRMEGVLMQMRDQNVKPDEVTFNTLINAYGKATEFEKMARALTSMTLKRKQVIKPMERTYNSMITHYGNAGMLQEVESIFEKLKEVHIKPNFITYEVMVGAYGKCAEFDKMLNCVMRMRRAGLVPQSSTLNKMLESYCQHGLINNAETLLTNATKVCNVEASPLSYEIVIRAHKKLGQRNQMQALYDRMKSLNVKPTKQTALYFREDKTETDCQNSGDEGTVATADDLDELSRITRIDTQNGQDGEITVDKLLSSNKAMAVAPS